MKVNEIFYSIQGEGFLAGVPSVFIRLAGCPLSCNYCDTKYSRNYGDGEELSAEQVISRVQNYPARYVVITGGEPMADAEMGERQGLRQLLSLLKNNDKHITIETAGIKFLTDLPCDLMSISPKPPAQKSIEELRLLIQNYNYQLKFVIENESDFAKAQELLTQIGKYDRDKVMLMPQAATRQQYLEKATLVAELCLAYNFAFSPRLQILLWNNTRGK
ncbi:MAG: 7-carboxy-7-deazaguanine synthase QueE [Phycisphaerae bacterium]|jgi:7-carboxy-7-deazaguanine synthase